MVRTQNPDIVFIQETKCQKVTDVLIDNIWDLRCMTGCSHPLKYHWVSRGASLLHGTRAPSLLMIKRLRRAGSG